MPGSTTVIFDLDFVAARLLVRTPPPFNAVQRNYWDARGRANRLHPGDVFPSTGFVELSILWRLHFSGKVKGDSLYSRGIDAMRGVEEAWG